MDFNKFNPAGKYDLIISCAVQHWTGMEAQKYTDKLYGLLNPGGYVLFEGHDVAKKKRNHGLKTFGKFKVIKKGIIEDNVKREFALLQRGGD